LFYARVRANPILVVIMSCMTGFIYKKIIIISIKLEERKK